jgi:hypothetical protein
MPSPARDDSEAKCYMTTRTEKFKQQRCVALLEAVNTSICFCRLNKCVDGSSADVVSGFLHNNLREWRWHGCDLHFNFGM